MYTWGYIKGCALAKLNLSEEEAQAQNFLTNFPYYANEAMTQICSAIKPKESSIEIRITDNANDITTETSNVFLKDTTIKPFPKDFVAFSDAPSVCSIFPFYDWIEANDEELEYIGYDELICHEIGTYRIPYKARWFFFEADGSLKESTLITAPADICDALPSYIVSQCYKIDDEVKASIYRNEYEMFLARIDDTDFKRQRTFNRGGGW